MHNTCYIYLAHMVCVPHVSHDVAPQRPTQLKEILSPSAWKPAPCRGSLSCVVGRRSCPRADSAFTPEKLLVSSHSAAGPLWLLQDAPGGRSRQDIHEGATNSSKVTEQFGWEKEVGVKPSLDASLEASSPGHTLFASGRSLARILVCYDQVLDKH